MIYVQSAQRVKTVSEPLDRDVVLRDISIFVPHPDEICIDAIRIGKKTIFVGTLSAEYLPSPQGKGVRKLYLSATVLAGSIVTVYFRAFAESQNIEANIRITPLGSEESQTIMLEKK